MAHELIVPEGYGSVDNPPSTLPKGTVEITSAPAEPYLWTWATRAHRVYGANHCRVTRSPLLPIEYRLYRTKTGNYECWAFTEGDSWEHMGESPIGPMRLKKGGVKTTKSPAMWLAFVPEFDRELCRMIAWYEAGKEASYNEAYEQV